VHRVLLGSSCRQSNAPYIACARAAGILAPARGLPVTQLMTCTAVPAYARRSSWWLLVGYTQNDMTYILCAHLAGSGTSLWPVGAQLSGLHSCQHSVPACTGHLITFRHLLRSWLHGNYAACAGVQLVNIHSVSVWRCLHESSSLQTSACLLSTWLCRRRNVTRTKFCRSRRQNMQQDAGKQSVALPNCALDCALCCCMYTQCV
jgi:hypothetical protein